MEEKRECIRIRFEELPELVPAAMDQRKDIVLDGFCNPLELQSFPLKGKAVYLNLFRRRWKHKGERQPYSNAYPFHAEGVKATREFAFF